MYILGIAEASFKHLHIFSPFTDFTDSLVTGAGAGAGACLTGSWGAWSGCSVTCGKGINMRSREYADPGQVSEDTCPVITPATCPGRGRGLRPAAAPARALLRPGVLLLGLARLGLRILPHRALRLVIYYT